MAQQKVQIEGKVIDKDSQKALPFAHVVISNKHLGAITDTNGVFNLTINSVLHTDTLSVLYLGYEPFSSTISSFLKGGSDSIELVKKDVEIKEVVISAKQINVEKFIKQTVKYYWENRRSSPHIALAHYREKAKFSNKYVMFSESTGFAIYTGDQAHDVESYYAFFCDNTRKSDRKEEWINLAKPGFNGEVISDVSCLSYRSYRQLEYMEDYGPISKKEWKNYSYTLDSSYFENDRKVCVIGFKRKSIKGKIRIIADNHEIRIIHSSHMVYGIGSSKKRIQETSNMKFVYYNHQPFIQSINTYHTDEGIEYWNECNTLLQKFDEFNLDQEAIWSLKQYTYMPFVNYEPEIWNTLNIPVEKDLALINKHLGNSTHTLEEQFIKNANQWWISDYEKLYAKDILQGIEDRMESAPLFVKELRKLF